MAEHNTQFASLDVQVDGQTAQAWDEIISRFSDASIYQSWAYGAVRWGARNLSHLVLRREGRILAAAQLRIARVPMLPVGVAYLRWGPLCHLKDQAFDPSVVAEMIRCLQHEYVKRRGLALQIIPSVFTGDERAAAFQSAFQGAGMSPEPALGNYRTIVVDLRPAAEVMRKRLDQKWRNQLNRAEKNGVMLETSDSPQAYREFLNLFAAMLERKQFDTTVDVNEFGRIQEHLTGSARMQIFLARSEGQVIGALVCSLLGDTAIYLLGATNERARELKAAYFLQWQAMLWLKEHGAQYYDLGGIDPVANPGGYHFKSGFGGTEAVQLAAHAHSGNLLSSGVTALAAWRRRPRQIYEPVVPVASSTVFPAN
jgi:lipid II:glycine glycyltransferase (peptidoglycan interpeptide bridge formation enzyme)